MFVFCPITVADRYSGEECSHEHWPHPFPTSPPHEPPNQAPSRDQPAKAGDLRADLRSLGGHPRTTTALSHLGVLPSQPPQQEAQKLLSKLGPDDNVEVFLYVFDNTIFQVSWAEEEWAWVLTLLLTGKAQWASYALPRGGAILTKTSVIVASLG